MLKDTESGRLLTPIYPKLIYLRKGDVPTTPTRRQQRWTQGRIRNKGLFATFCVAMIVQVLIMIHFTTR